MAFKPNARWVVEWRELTVHAQRLQQDEKDGGPLYEHDMDRNEVSMFLVFKRPEEAQAKAKEIVRSGVTVYGYAQVQLEHRLPIEGTTHWDWEPIGDPEVID